MAIIRWGKRRECGPTRCRSGMMSWREAGGTNARSMMQQMCWVRLVCKRIRGGGANSQNSARRGVDDGDGLDTAVAQGGGIGRKELRAECHQDTEHGED